MRPLVTSCSYFLSLSWTFSLALNCLMTWSWMWFHIQMTCCFCRFSWSSPVLEIIFWKFCILFQTSSIPSPVFADASNAWKWWKKHGYYYSVKMLASALTSKTHRCWKSRPKMNNADILWALSHESSLLVRDFTFWAMFSQVQCIGWPTSFR